MKAIRKIVCLCLCFALLFLTACKTKNPTEDPTGDPETDPSAPSSDPAPSPEEPYPDSFLPMLRFAITSDIHVRAGSNDYGSSRKLISFIDSAKAYAASYSPYTDLDGIFIVGDLTQDGKTSEYSVATDTFDWMVGDDTVLAVAMGNHEMHAYGSGNERFTPENVAKSTARYKSALGYESEDMHLVINGYHFIILANDSYETRNFFDDASLTWLEAEIAAAIAQDPTSDKPIFVMQHEPPKSSVRGFTGGDERLGALLKNYPRVVDFSGHTHRSILDPQSIWQDGFTAIGTGGLAYLGFNMAGHPTLDNSAVAAIDEEGGYIGGASNAERTGAMYYIVEVDANNNIRLKIYDILTGGFYGDPIVFKVGSDEPEVFTSDRAERSVAPIFGSDAKIEVLSGNYNYAKISFSTPTGGDLTQYYRIELWEAGLTEPSATLYRLGDMHLAADPPDTAPTQLRGYSHSGEYTVKIYAVNCWGKESVPLTGIITIGEKSLTPDILNTVFNSDGTASSGSYGTLGAVGNVSVSYDEALGRTVASFDGSSGYKFSGISDYSGRLHYALTLEAYFRVADGLESSVAIGANNNSSGFGIAYRPDGSLRFNYSVNNGGGRSYLYATTAPGIAEAGEWVHVVAVVDSQSIMLYVNGEQAIIYDTDGVEIGTSLSRSGRLFEPTTGRAAVFIVGADVSSSGGIETGFVGEIAALNLYSRALDASEISALYLAY